MVDFQDVLQAVDSLSEEEKQRLLRYLQQSMQPKNNERLLNMHPGAIVIGDDFNDELPDSFWLDEE